MRFLRRARVSVFIAVAIGLAAGGIAYAAIPGPGGVIQGCYQKSGGSLRVVDSAASCKPSEKSLSWDQRGATGPSGTPGAVGATGATGPSGPAGPSGSTRAWALIDGLPSSSIVYGHDVASVAHSSTDAGVYCVLLDPSIDVTTAAAHPSAGRHASASG
jgi:hypothetical protein